MGGLTLGAGGPDDDLGGGSPLSGFTPEPKELMFSRATQALRQHAAELDPDPMMLMAQNAGEAPLSKRQIFEKLQEGANALETNAAQARARLENPPLNDMVPFLRGASGFLRPTRTGSFGETLGSGLGEFAAGLGDQEKSRLAFAEKAAELDYRTGKDRADFVKEGLGLGLRADQIESMLLLARSRLQQSRYKNVPLVGMVDTQTIENGAPKIVHPAPEFQKMLTQFEGTIEKAAAQKVFPNMEAREAWKAEQRADFRRRYIADPAGITTNFPSGAPNTQATVSPGGAQPGTGVPAPAPAGGVPAAPAGGAPAAPGAAAALSPAVDPRMKGGPELAGDVEGEKKIAENEAKFADAFVHEMQGQSDQKYLLDRMQQDFRNLPSDPGKLLSVKAAIAAWKMALGVGTDQDRALAANSEALNKEAGQLMSAWLKTLTSRPTQMEVAMALDRFIPNTGLTAAGAKKLIEQMRAASQRGYHRADKYLNEWRPAHKRGEYMAYPSYWDKTYSKGIPFEMPQEQGADGPLNDAERREMEALEAELHGKKK